MDQKHSVFLSAFSIGLLGIGVATTGNFRFEIAGSVAVMSLVLMCLSVMSIALATRMQKQAIPVHATAAHARLQPAVIETSLHRAKGLTRTRQLIDLPTADMGSGARATYRPYLGTGHTTQRL